MLAATLGAVVAGCAVSTQLGPIFGMAGGDIVTGSITPRDKRFSSAMTDEDWAKARDTLDLALAPDNAGKPLPWENPATGLSGTVTPVATAYVADEETCHAFVASVVEGIDTHWVQGRACRGAEPRWTVVDLSGWTPPA